MTSVLGIPPYILLPALSIPTSLKLSWSIIWLCLVTAPDAWANHAWQVQSDYQWNNKHIQTLRLSKSYHSKCHFFSFNFFSFLQLELNILNKGFSFELGHEFLAKPRKYIEVVLWPESFCNKAAQRGRKNVSMFLSPRSCPSFISVLWDFQDMLPFIINSNFGWTQFLLSYVFSEIKSQTSVN